MFIKPPGLHVMLLEATVAWEGDDSKMVLGTIVSGNVQFS